MFRGTSAQNYERTRIAMKTIPIILILLTGCSWSHTDKALLLASIGASYADYNTTTRMLDENGYEMNPLIGKHPSHGELAAWLISSEALVIILAHYYPKWRTPLLSGKFAINGACAIHNSKE
jgi:hypothetical protein